MTSVNISMSKYRNAVRGFTLVELLVVISIISLLISILMPSLSAARAQAQKIRCMANMKGIGAAVDIYQHESDGRMLTAGNYCGGTAGAPDYGNKDRWYVTLARSGYLKTELPSFAYYDLLQLPILNCPTTYYDISAGKTQLSNTTYKITGWIGQNSLFSTSLGGVNRPGLQASPKITEIQLSPSTVIYMSEAALDASNNTSYLAGQPSNAFVTNVTDPISQVHLGGSNLLYMDGHGEWWEKRRIVRRPDTGVLSTDGNWPRYLTNLAGNEVGNWRTFAK